METISKFSATYRNLTDMSITPKIHILEIHIVDFLKRKREPHGLGFWSEQGFEAMHHDMQKEWNTVKNCDLDHPDFPERLLKFVCRYNAKHV